MSNSTTKPDGWKDDWQEVCNGRGETLYWVEPNGAVHYPDGKRPAVSFGARPPLKENQNG